MSRVVINIKDKSKEKALIKLLKDLPYVDIEEKTKSKKDDVAGFKKLYGIWKGRSVSLEKIRENAWKRK